MIFHTVESTNTRIEDGSTRSSVDAPAVMNVERRGADCFSRIAGQLPQENEPVTSAKPFVIPKRLVLEVYKRVKTNHGSAGAE